MVARAERAKYHGVGENNKHLLSDIAIRSLGLPDRAQQEFAAQATVDQEWFSGYATGYSKYVRETGRDNISSWCRGAEWVREISPEDLFARFQTMPQTTPYMADMIAAAAPPESKRSSAVTPTSIQTLAELNDTLRAGQLGSNGWAIGKDRTENGRGMLLGNPHYPWTGTNRLWEKHLVIPGKMNLYGAHLIGMPGVAIGFNESVGWTHTVSNSQRVVFYSLDLVPGDPTSYYYDGEPRKMTAREFLISVRDEDGVERTKEHTVWFSHYGPIVSPPNAPWSDNTAISIRDANFRNQNLFAHWRDMGQAEDMDAFKGAFDKWNSIPWVNTMATSSDGRAVYIDGSSVGRLSDEAIALWQERIASESLTKTFYEQTGLILLDGSDSRFEWQPHPEARIDGIVPFAEQPQQDRTDYIFNANDSHWLTNVTEPLTGYSPLYGPEETARSLRTRMNARLLSDTSPGGPTGDDGKFSLREMQQALLSNRSLTADLLLDELLTACAEHPAALVDEQRVDLGNACTVLQGYDRRLDLDSAGAVLFREWITRYEPSEYLQAGELFAVPFDAEDPVNTPRDLADKRVALEKLAEAALVLDQAGVDLDSTLRDVQFVYRGSEKVPLHGGGPAEGIANVIGQINYDTVAEQTRGHKIDGSRWLTDKGYAITYGTSFLLSLSYTDNGPVAEAFLTYSESGDPSSEHYMDQTRLFSEKQWRPVLFETKDINEDVKSSVVLTEPRHLN